MACKGCARRANKLMARLGFHRGPVGPNRRVVWVFETENFALLIPGNTLRWQTTRATILAVLTRLFFGASRAHEPPTPTEILHLREMPSDFKATYWRSGMTVQAVKMSSFFEIRRGPWLRLVGPVSENLLVEEKPAEPVLTTPVLTTK